VAGWLAAVAAYHITAEAQLRTYLSLLWRLQPAKICWREISAAGWLSTAAPGCNGQPAAAARCFSLTRRYSIYIRLSRFS